MEQFKHCASLWRNIQPPVLSSFQVIGAWFVFRTSCTFLKWTSQWLLPEIPLNRFQRTTGAWALVTGSSAGIGLSCAHALAKRGFNVVLRGHQTEELDEARQTIKARYPNVKTKVVVINAITATLQDVEEVVRGLDDLDLSVIVNNLGGIPVPPSLYYRRLDSFTSSQTEATLALNVHFMTHLNRLAVPALARSGPSLILNVGSASDLGFPGAATYSGSKAFVLSFTKALAREAKADGLPIDITAAVLGEVRTQANKTVPAGSPDADEFGEAMIRGVGRAVKRGQMSFHPFLRHAIQDFAVELMPGWLRESVLESAFRQKRRYQEKLV